jgi:ZIP family zinc transporter
MFSPTIWHGFIAAALAGLLTGLGGLMIFLKKRYAQSDVNALLNVAAGVMLAASFFALLMPALQTVTADARDIHSAAFAYCGAVFAGVLFVWVLNALLPHEHNQIGHHGPFLSLKKAWLFIIAIALHKVPEGLAVGVAYSASALTNPISLVIGIALHNVPEGLTMAVALVGAGQSRARAALTAFGIGMLQPLGALLGLPFASYTTLIPYAMALAGGTLLFVVVNEILPETYGYKQTQRSAFAVFTGFIVMTYLVMVLE